MTPVRKVSRRGFLNDVFSGFDGLADKFGVSAEIYSAPSFPLLRRDALGGRRTGAASPRCVAYGMGVGSPRVLMLVMA